MNEIREAFRKYGLPQGKCLGSKTYYLRMFPKDHIVFNARVYTQEVYDKYADKDFDIFEQACMEEWCGDLNLSKDTATLQSIVNELGTPIAICNESGYLQLSLAAIVEEE